MAMAAKTLAETVYFYPRNAMLTTDTSKSQIPLLQIQTIR